MFKGFGVRTSDSFGRFARNVPSGRLGRLARNIPSGSTFFHATETAVGAHRSANASITTGIRVSAAL